MPRHQRNGGATIALRDPVFLTIADDAVIRRTAANGVRGTAMPALRKALAECSPTNRSMPWFVESGPGLSLVFSPALIPTLRSANSRRPAARRGGVSKRSAPPVTAPMGPRQEGQLHCRWSYLALVSDQYLRTTVIAGGRNWVRRTGGENVPAGPCPIRKSTDVSCLGGLAARP